MEPMTIELPEALRAEAERRAKSRGVSLEQFIREAVERSVEEEVGVGGDLLDLPVFSDEGPTDMAERHDDYLYGEREA